MIWRLRFCNKDGVEARVEIQRGVSTPIVDVEGTNNPFTLSYNNDKGDKSGMFLTSSADIEIYETEDFNIDDLKTSNETELSVTYYINDVVKWKGFIIPDFFSIEVRSNPVIVMTASDRLGTLKNVTLSDLPSMISLRELAILCLNKTGLSLPLKTMADFSNGTGVNDFFNSKILTQRLSDTKGRSISCYDILSSILTASNSKLLQRSGEWVIINKLQHEAGSGKLFSSATSFINWADVIFNFSDINVGGRRTIVPVASTVGVFHEYGGGKLHPDNYDFSQGLTGWTPVGGFVAGIGNQSVTGYEIQSGVYVPIYGEPGLNHLKNANPYQRNTNPIYLESAPISVPYSGSGAVNIEFDINGVGPMLTTQAIMRIAIVAQRGEELLTLHHGGSFNPMPSINPPVFEKKFKKGFTSSDFTAKADTQNMRVSGTLESSELEGWELKIRIYGGGSSNTILINAASIHMKSSQETPKGAIYKRDQGSDFTKTHDIETSIFGDYLTGGRDGYFYDYPIDDTSSLYNSANELTSKWTAYNDTEQLPLLQHVSRQKSRLFSVAHDLLRAEIEASNFDPLAIFVACEKRYTVVSGSFDFFRSHVKVELEEVAFQNNVTRDYIYSYFGEGEDNIKSIGGIAGGGGGGTTGGGLTPEQLEILSWWKKDPDNPDTIFTEMNAYSKLELSAYGAGAGGGGGGGGDGIIETVYGYGNLGQTFNNSVLTDTFNAYTINQINARVTALEQSAGSGSVTSVGISVPTGLSVANSPITSSGVIAIGLQTGYSIPTTAKQANWDTAFTNNHTHSNKGVLDGITSGLVTNWDTAFDNNHTHSNKTVLDGITSALVSNWNTALSDTHTHSNKTQLDLITQSNIDVLAKLSIVNGNLQIDGNAYATGELSAYGAGSGGGGGGGIIETVYGYGNLGQTFNNSILTDTFNAYTINQLHTRLNAVEAGSATTINTTGTGNAITSLTKSGTVITANKGLTFALSTHTHTIAQITGLQGALDLKATQSDIDTAIDGIEIGGRNLCRKDSDIQAYDGSLIARTVTGFNLTGNPGGYATVRWMDVFPVISDTYTFSFEAYSDVNGAPFYLQVNDVTIATVVMTDVYKKYQYTFTPQNDQYNFIDFQDIQGFNYYFKNVKLEKGNKATDWTPAPEDQVSDWSTTDVTSFSYIKNKPTQLSQFTDNIGVASHIANKANPHNVTKAQVGLGSVDNTADSVKNVLSATKLTTARTIAGVSFNGTANIAIPFANLSSKPTTLAGYGITDAVTTNTTQTITGAKTFDANITLGVNRYIQGTDNYAGVWNVNNLLWRFGSSKAGSVSNIRSEKVGIGTDNPLYKLDVSGDGRFTGNVTAPTFIGALTGNADTATKLATPRTIWGQSFDGTANVNGALSGATTITASTSVTTPRVIFNSAGWSMEQVGSELQLKHNNVLKMRFTSTGSVVAVEEITAFG